MRTHLLLGDLHRSYTHLLPQSMSPEPSSRYCQLTELGACRIHESFAFLAAASVRHSYSLAKLKFVLWLPIFVLKPTDAGDSFKPRRRARSLRSSSFRKT